MPAKGFTLVEMLVALAVMALLALMSWRGLDAMLRTQQASADRHMALQSLQGGLLQWQLDLDAAVQTPYVNAVEWNGQVLRVLRRGPATGPEALQVVAWALGPAEATAAQAGADASVSSWLRWQSPPLQTRAALLAAWEDAATWGAAPQALSVPPSALAAASPATVRVAPVVAWALAYERGGQWVPADSLLRARGSGLSVADFPKGLRLELMLGSSGPLQGQLRSDWFDPLSGAAP